jgi:cytochrome c
MALSVAAAAALLSSMPALAAGNVQSMLQSNGCSACHAQSQKVVGPAWGWIAYRYQGKKNAVDSVTNFIINGGVGYWEKWTGAIPMPSHPNISKAQAEEIAKWVLAQPAIKPPARN